MDNKNYKVFSVTLAEEDVEFLGKEAKRLDISKSEYVSNMIEVIKLLKGRFMIIEK